MVELLAGSSGLSSASASGVPETQSRRPAPQTHYVTGVAANNKISDSDSTSSSEGGFGQDPSALEAGEISRPVLFHKAEPATDGAPAALRNDEDFWGEARVTQKEAGGAPRQVPGTKVDAAERGRSAPWGWFSPQSRGSTVS